MTTHLYIHLPFCEQRCGYCDFFSTAAGKANAPRYLAALLEELRTYDLPPAGLDTVYIGGGTPSYLGVAFLESLLAAVRPLAAPGAEITLEANPLSFDGELAAALAAAGVNRVSIGVQSFDREMRRRLGRRGGAEAAAAAVAAGRAAGISQLSIDMLFALPGQTAGQLASDLELAIALAPEHISCYELTVKAGSDFGERWRSELETAQEGARGFYERVSATLEGAGYHSYEVSNYARRGCECRHNLAYWRGEDYIGIGAGAWSTIGSERWRNREDVDDYSDDVRAGRLEESLSDSQKAVEALMLGLRTRYGVEIERVAAVIDAGQLAQLEQNGFIIREGAKILLTRAGSFVANDVCTRLLVDPPPGSRPES